MILRKNRGLWTVTPWQQLEICLHLQANLQGYSQISEFFRAKNVAIIMYQIWYITFPTIFNNAKAEIFMFLK